MVQVLIAILSSTWGRRVLYVLGSVAMLALGVAIGRFAIPKVVTVTRTETKVEVREVVKVVRVKDRNVVKTTKTTTIPTPEGPKTVTETTTKVVERTDTNRDTNTHSDTAAVGNSVVTSGGGRADWRVSALGGMLIAPSGEVSWLVGAGAERRIAGPVYGGLWGMGGPKAGAAGISLSVEF